MGKRVFLLIQRTAKPHLKGSWSRNCGHFCNPSQGFHVHVFLWHLSSPASTISPPFRCLPALTLHSPKHPHSLSRLFTPIHTALCITSAALEAPREVRELASFGARAMFSLPGEHHLCCWPQSGGGPVGLLSHCVSHSSCGPPRASWAVGNIPALGTRPRWKPLSVPTLLGEPPPLLGCQVGVRILSPLERCLPTHLKGLYL